MRVRVKIDVKELARYRNKLLNMKRKSDTVIEKKMKDMAEKFETQLKNYIEVEGQRIFAKIEYRKGLILIRSRVYIDSIKVHFIGKKHYYVGFNDSDIEPDTKIYLYDLAEKLEDGTVNIKARPHWTPVSNRFRKSSFYRMCGEMLRDITND